MKVYIVYTTSRRLGFEILGVFASPKGADACVQKAEQEALFDNCSVLHLEVRP